MDDSTPGGAGVLEWANNIRLTLAKDEARQLLHDRIQDTLGFLDNYLENALKGPRAEALTELLKTPGRRKNAPARTRSEVATSARKDAIITMSLDTDDEQENRVPVNSFHKALLQAKMVPDEDMASAAPSSAGTASPEPVATELSMIAEDDEFAERSRLSALPAPPSTAVSHRLKAEVPTIDEAKPTTTDTATHMDVDEPGQTEVLSTTDTFHSIPLDSPELHSPTTPPRSPSPVVDEAQASPEPIPIVPSATSLDELSAPIRDEPSSNTLNRKPSLSQIGLPAPSPLHKSTRTGPGREPSVGAALGPGAKRGSWLVKAREAKAIETAGKRTSNTLGVGLGLGILGAKRKSGDMLELAGMGGPIAGSSKARDDEDRVTKAAKLAEDDGSARKGRFKVMSIEEPPSLSPKPTVQMQMRASTVPPEDFTVPIQFMDEDEPLLDTFKRKIEGVRPGKSMGKSLGGSAAAALAEARAAAEARVAERNKLERANESAVQDETSIAEADPQVGPVSDETAPVPDLHKRLSISDLLGPSSNKEQPPLTGREPPLSALNVEAAGANADTSTSTTPPNSPPPRPAPVAAHPIGPVFTKPPTVFVAPPAPFSTAQGSEQQPSAGSSKDFSFKMPTGHPFSLPAAMTLGVPAKLGSPNSQKSGGLSAQSSKASVFSDSIFDTQDSVPAWMPQTQDTEYSTQPTSQSQSQPKFDDTDDDDSWHVDDKFAAHQMWTPFGFTSAENRDDTWSTLASRSTSQKGGDTGFLTTNFTKPFVARKDVEVDDVPSGAGVEPSSAIPSAFDFGQEPVEPVEEVQEADIADVSMEMDDRDGDEDMEETDLEDVALAGKSTVSLVQSGVERSQSQQSMNASTASSSQQSQAGFIGQATKFVSSMLGGSKKKAEPVKSLQLAAQAAKKQQGELEKKATRLKEMENRRQLAQQRKVDEEQLRTQEEERKIKEENERRKKEREEHTDKRPLSRMASKKQLSDDDTKKRKIELEKKPVEFKKPPSKERKDAPPRVITKPGTGSVAHTPGAKFGPPPKTAMKQMESETKPSTKIVKPIPSSVNLNLASSSSNPKIGPPKVVGKGKAPARDDDEQQPAQAIRTQMADRAKAQIQAQTVPGQPLPGTSEAIELPDVNSEYSNSDDEDRVRTFDPPEWAQSPELRVALEQQAMVNPDDVFGQIPPLRMEDMFRTRQSRFRARTSSANWSGPDGLTEQEEREYARRMGFK